MQRYIEKIPMLIDHLLVLALKKEIPKALLSKLPLDKRALCAELLKQADDVTSKRKWLKGRRLRLERGRPGGAQSCLGWLFLDFLAILLLRSSPLDPTISLHVGVTI